MISADERLRAAIDRVGENAAQAWLDALLRLIAACEYDMLMQRLRYANT